MKINLLIYAESYLCGATEVHSDNIVNGAKTLGTIATISSTCDVIWHIDFNIIAILVSAFFSRLESFSRWIRDFNL